MSLSTNTKYLLQEHEPRFLLVVHHLRHQKLRVEYILLLTIVVILGPQYLLLLRSHHVCR